MRYARETFKSEQRRFHFLLRLFSISSCCEHCWTRSQFKIVVLFCFSSIPKQIHAAVHLLFTRRLGVVSRNKLWGYNFQWKIIRNPEAMPTNTNNEQLQKALSKQLPQAYQRTGTLLSTTGDPYPMLINSTKSTKVLRGPNVFLSGLNARKARAL